jgi:hypothetical protein
MVGSCICPISKVTARDILKDIIRNDPRFLETPTIDGAIHLADALKKERDMFVRPDCLLEDWAEVIKERSVRT